MKTILFLTLALSTTSLWAGSLKIMSMNLHCGLGDWKGRLDQVVEEILTSRPDVIGLQEVCFNNTMNMEKYLLDGLRKGGYDIKFSRRKLTHRSFIKYQEELLMISRKEVSAYREGMLPSMKTFENGFLAFKIDEGWMVTSHLHFLLPHIRKTQFSVLSNIFSKDTAILFGDLNSNPRDGETKPFAHDDWSSIFGGPTYPSTAPKKTFDGFWLTRSFAKTVDSSHFERLFVGDKNPPSDHLGISVELTLK